MKVHLFLCSTSTGNLDIDKKFPEVSKIFKDAKKISKSSIENLACIEIDEPIKDIKLISIHDKKVDIPVSLNYKVFKQQ